MCINPGLDSIEQEFLNFNYADTDNYLKNEGAYQKMLELISLNEMLKAALLIDEDYA